MDKHEVIKKMISDGWVRHNGTEYGDRGKKTKGKQHKTSSKIGLSECRSLNAWLRTQDSYWVAPDGQVLHWMEYDKYKPDKYKPDKEKQPMKPTQRTSDEYLRIVNILIPMGWMPIGEFGSMVFRRNGKNYDLSAADLTKLDDIEKNGSFLISDQ